MSQENVEIVRSLWEAWDRRDADAIFPLYDPEVDVVPHSREGTFMSESYHGHDGVRRWIRDWMDAFDGFYFHADEYLNAGGCVLVHATQGGRGKGSGVTVERSLWFLYRLQRGRIVRIETYDSKAEALEAVGLGSSASSDLALP